MTKFDVEAAYHSCPSFRSISLRLEAAGSLLCRFSLNIRSPLRALYLQFCGQHGGEDSPSCSQHL